MTKQSQNLDTFFELGEKAQKLLHDEKYQQALQTYTQLIQKIEDVGGIDSYVVAKTTLGLLLSLVRLGHLDRAFEVWNAPMDESLVGLGIFALENAQTNLDDMITYDCVCAFLHSVSDASKKEAGQAVNQYMSRVCEHALERGDRALMMLALSNWKNHLRQVFGSAIPYEFAAPIISFEKQFGEPVRPRAIDYPKQADWTRPDGFQEMSRVVAMGHKRRKKQVLEIDGATARKSKK
jgi:hypothetical protein